ncbi:MAG: serine--tRNA ligase [Candidatus Bathyarchaeota archaeon]|nr:serine--tRNA ligase [Candidatus Bathyarchaeota archaeon]
MLDIRLIRQDPTFVRNNLTRRGNPEYITLLDTLLKDDHQWRQALSQLNDLRHTKNNLTLEIAILKKNKKDASDKIAIVSNLSQNIKTLEDTVESFEIKTRHALLRLPNLLHTSVPYGIDDTENVEVKQWGEPPQFDFTPKSHVELLTALDLIDLERAAKVSGAGFYYLKGDLVLLDLAIQRFAIDFLRKEGFTVISPPLMLKRKPYEGVTDLDDFESVMYKIQGEDVYLIATSEHVMAAMFMDEVLDLSQLPVKLCGVSPCFRREIGTHGRYTKGLFRVHQFNKVEQFIFSTPEQSWELHEYIQHNSEKLYQALGLHYRVVNVCTGDIGSIAAKKYDTELWMADGQFRESGSNSNCTDYQARRLNIRYREKTGQSPIGPVNTLNNTALAGRTMIAILEQCQLKDGSVDLPTVLHPYMDGQTKLCKE